MMYKISYNIQGEVSITVDAPNQERAEFLAYKIVKNLELDLYDKSGYPSFTVAQNIVPEYFQCTPEDQDEE